MEAVRLCRLAARSRPVYVAAVGVANTAVMRASSWLDTAEAEDGADVARHCLSLTRSLAEPISAIEAFRSRLLRLDVNQPDHRAAKARLLTHLSNVESKLAEIRKGIEAVEFTAEAQAGGRMGPQPALAELRAKVKSYKPDGDQLGPLIERLRREHGISDSELEMIRRHPRFSYALA